MSEYKHIAIRPVKFKDFARTFAGVPNAHGQGVRFLDPHEVTVADNEDEMVKGYRIVSEDEYVLEVYVEFMDEWERAVMEIADPCARLMLRNLLVHRDEAHQMHYKYTEEGDKTLIPYYKGMADSLEVEIAELLTYCGHRADLYDVRRHADEMLRGLSY